MRNLVGTLVVENPLKDKESFMLLRGALRRANKRMHEPSGARKHQASGFWLLGTGCLKLSTLSPRHVGTM